MRLNSILRNAVKHLVFDKKVRIKHLDISSNKEQDPHLYDYLREFAAKDVCDRLDDMMNKERRRILNIGSNSNLILNHINPDRVESLTQVDISSGRIKLCKHGLQDHKESRRGINNDYLICDEEHLPFKESSMDLIMSCLTLHWINDLVGCFKNIRGILKPNCPFMGVIFGGDTLFELRSSLQLAEVERLSGFSSHVAPKTTGQDVARLLQSTGFQLITVDTMEIKIRYPSMFELMFDLQGMGENDCSLIASKHLNRDVLKASAAIYQSLYGDKDPDRGIPATFQMLHFVGWKDPEKATPLDTTEAFGTS